MWRSGEASVVCHWWSSQNPTTSFWNVYLIKFFETNYFNTDKKSTACWKLAARGFFWRFLADFLAAPSLMSEKVKKEINIFSTIFRLSCSYIFSKFQGGWRYQATHFAKTWKVIENQTSSKTSTSYRGKIISNWNHVFPIMKCQNLKILSHGMSVVRN